MKESAIDHEARRDAALANQKIDSHEDRCTERWGEARKSLDSLGRAVETVHHRINQLIKVAFLVVLGMTGFALVQWLLARGIAG